MRILIILLVVLAALAAGGYYGVPYLQDELTAESRAELVKDGEAQSFVKLDSGTVHYRSAVPFGPSAGTIVLVHGFSSHSYIWREHMNALASRGYRVIAVDLYGRGYSDRVDGPYKSALFVRQLKEFIDEMSPRRQVHLIGYSMGGAIALDLAAEHPARVETLGLIAPAGFACGQSGAGWIAWPVIGDLLFRIGGGSLLASRAAGVWAESSDPDYYAEGFRKQTRFRGYTDALLSTLRNYPMADRCDIADEAAQGISRVLVMWGEDDTVTPASGADTAEELIPSARVVRVKGVGHGLPIAKPEQVVSEIALLASLEP